MESIVYNQQSIGGGPEWEYTTFEFEGDFSSVEGYGYKIVDIGYPFPLTFQTRTINNWTELTDNINNRWQDINLSIVFGSPGPAALLIGQSLVNPDTIVITDSENADTVRGGTIYMFVRFKN